MKTKIILFLMLFFSIMIYSQVKNEKKEQQQDIKIIIWDYSKKNFVDSKVYKNLCVNDIVQIKIISIPKNSTVQSEVTFQNQHLEMQGKFGQFIQFDTNNTANFDKTTPTSPKTIKDSLENKDNDIEKETIEEVNKTINNKGKIKLKDSYKINRDNLSTALLISDAEQFIGRQKENEIALKDLSYQKYLIKIAQKNWNKQIEYRDSIIIKNTELIESLEYDNKNKDKQLENFGKGTTHYLLPVKIQNFDYTVFSTSIRGNNSQEELIVHMPFHNQGGIKVDFSSGLLVNGLYSPTYMLIKENEEYSTIKEEVDKKTKFNTGISLLAHIYKRGNEFLNYAISSGFSYNLNQQNINFLLGGSVLMGSDQRFIFTGGVNVGRVSQLAGYYQVNQTYKTDSFGTDAKIPMVNVLKASWFVGISYNLGINKSSAKVKL